MSNLDLKNIIEHGNLDFEDVRKLYSMMEKQNTLSKYNFPKKPSSDGYYHVYVKDPTLLSGRRQIKDKNLDGLKEKVFNFEKYNSTEVRKTFADVFNLTQVNKLKYVKNPEKKLSVQNTVQRIESEYNRLFHGTNFEKMFVNEITEKDIENICYLNLKRLDMRKKSFLFMRSILKSVFVLAFQERWIDDDPYCRVNFKKFSDMLVTSTPIAERVHTSDEINLMIQYTHNKQLSKPKYIASFAFELQMIMGLREGEVPALMWEDIKDGYIFIHRMQIVVRKNGTSTQHPEIVNHTKTWKDRKYPITNEVADLLVRLKAVHDNYYQGSKYLFPSSKRPDRPILNHTLYNYYHTMCKSLDINIDRNIIRGPHSFRRNAITKVVNSGGDMLMASRLFGNSPRVADNNYYTGLDLSAAKNIIELGNQQ